MFGVGVIFQRLWCSAASSGARRLWIEALVPRVPSSGCKETLKSASGGVGFQKHRLRLCIRLSSDSVTVQGDGPPHSTARPDSRMSTFPRSSVPPTSRCNLKAAIVAAGFRNAVLGTQVHGALPWSVRNAYSVSDSGSWPQLRIERCPCQIEAITSPGDYECLRLAILAPVCGLLDPADPRLGARCASRSSSNRPCTETRGPGLLDSQVAKADPPSSLRLRRLVRGRNQEGAAIRMRPRCPDCREARAAQQSSHPPTQPRPRSRSALAPSREGRWRDTDPG